MATRVLLVEQSALIQKMVAEAFAQERIEVIKVASGDLATWLVNQINPDLVIADVSVPDTSGYELCQYIKGDARLSHIPVVLLYWPDETFDYTKAKGARADAYLTKPFESQALIEIAQRLLQDGGEQRPPAATIAPPLPDLQSVPVVEDEPLDISDVFEEANFVYYLQAGSESEPPLLLEDSSAPSGVVAEPAPVEQALTETEEDRNLISHERPRSGKTRAAFALAAVAVLAVALTLWLWKSNRVDETLPASSPTVSNPQSETPPQTDSVASKESSQPASSNFIDDKRSNSPAASVFKAKSNSTANRFEDRQANNFYAPDRTASQPSRPTPPASNQPPAMPEKSSRIEQSPPRTISSNAAAPAIPNDVKSGSGSQQPFEPRYGFRQAGSEVKGAVVWTGKKTGRGLRAIGRGLKRLFKHDSKID